jgi:hypothetical protein
VDKKARMDGITQPGKEAVREWLVRRRAAFRPLPDAEQIRRELGWKLIASIHDAGRRSPSKGMK